MITAAIAPCNAKTRPQAGDSLATTGLKITLLSGRPVVDGVFLNGAGPFRFLVDTGASTNQVEAAIARQMDLKPTFRSELATIAGSALVPGGRVARVKLGTATAIDQEFLFTGMEGVHRLSSSIQGVIGQEFLSRFDYLLDLSGRRIVFGAEETEGGGRADLSYVNGRPAVETDLGKLVLDSGTEVAILYAASVEKSGAGLITAAGSAPRSETRDMKVHIAGRVYSAVAAYVPKASFGLDEKEDGLLPANAFRGVFVSNSAKYVVLDPKFVHPLQ